MRLACMTPVPIVPLVPEGARARAYGAIGTIGTGPAIPPEEVRALFESTLRRLTQEHRLDPAEAYGRACDIVLGELLNDPRLTPRYTRFGECVVCGRREGPGRPLIPVLSPIEGKRLWLHLENCRVEYQRSQRDKALALLHDAGLQWENRGQEINSSPTPVFLLPSENKGNTA